MWQEQYERYAGGFNNLRQRPIFTFAMRQPRWVTLAAVVAGLLVIAVPLAILTLAAILVGMLVMFVFGIVATVANLLATLGSGSTSSSSPTNRDGRRNVRVIRRHDQ